MSSRFCRLILSAALILAAGLTSGAQTIQEEPNFDLRSRFSLSLDKKIARGAHVYAEAEARTKDMAVKFDRLYGTVGASYKFTPFLKTGLEYSAIWNGSCLRHRVSASLSGSVRMGAWDLSLRERLQCTHRSGEFNTYQQPRNLVQLKSRLKLSYHCFSKPLEPYIFCELDNPLNAARYSSTTAESMSYTDAYLKKIRTGLGTEWRISKDHFLDFYGLIDHATARSIDATKKGTLKTISYGNDWNLSLGIAYRFRL